jgi:hypothetical protein
MPKLSSAGYHQLNHVLELARVQAQICAKITELHEDADPTEEPHILKKLSPDNAKLLDDIKRDVNNALVGFSRLSSSLIELDFDSTTTS